MLLLAAACCAGNRAPPTTTSDSDKADQKRKFAAAILATDDARGGGAAGAAKPDAVVEFSSDDEELMGACSTIAASRTIMPSKIVAPPKNVQASSIPSSSQQIKNMRFADIPSLPEEPSQGSFLDYIGQPSADYETTSKLAVPTQMLLTSTQTYAVNAPGKPESPSKNKAASVAASSYIKAQPLTAAQENDRACVVSIASVAYRLECECQKFPKGGSGMFSGAKQRYIAAVPDAQDATASQVDWAEEIQRWRRGKLVYWKDKAAMEKKAQSKGSVPLMGISKISWHKTAPLDVVVKHVEDGQPCEMLLKFTSEKWAEEWSLILTELRKTLSKLS